jgi:hypothetical protein
MSNVEQVEMIKGTIEEMIGGTYHYGHSQHTIKRYRINEERERVTIITDKNEFDRPLDAVMEFLNLFEAVEKPVSALQTLSESSMTLPQMQINGSVIRELKDVLMDNIKKVKEDKNYIPQAQAIKENVDAVIDLAKTEVSYMEAYVRMHRI